MRPSLGVLIPYYNEGHLFTECLDTLLSGPDKPDEILIYDDASQDPAERYVKDHHPVRIIRGTKNIGLGLARNELMKASQSDFIHFQDADDFFDPTWCQKVREGIGDGDVDIVFNNVSIVDVDTRDKIVGQFYRFPRLEATGDPLLFFLAGALPIWVAMLTFRRQHGLEAGGYLPRDVIDVLEDREFHMRLFARKPRYRALSESLVLKCRRPNTLSCDREAKVRKEIYVARVKVLKMFLDWLPADYYPYLILSFLRDGIALFPFGEIELAKQAFQSARSLGLEEKNKQKFSFNREAIGQLFLKNGVLFFRAGEIKDARSAFRLARYFGFTVGRKWSRAYRIIFKMLGPEVAEWCVFFYSRIVSPRLRAFLRGRTR